MRAVASCAGLLVSAALSSYAGVSLSVDSSTTLTTTTWPGSPAVGLNPPNGGSSVDGNVTDGIFFQPSTGFTLGSFEYYSANGGAGFSSIGTYNLALYNLGSSYTLPGTSPLYTFTGSEVDLLSAGLNFTTTANNQFNVLTFSGADQVSLSGGNTYLLTLTTASGDNTDIERGNNSTGSGNPNFATQALGVATAAPGSGTAVNNVPAGHRDAVGAFYAVAPEPSSLAIAGAGILMLGAIRRLKK